MSGSLQGIRDLLLEGDDPDFLQAIELLRSVDPGDEITNRQVFETFEDYLTPLQDQTKDEVGYHWRDPKLLCLVEQCAKLVRDDIYDIEETMDWLMALEWLLCRASGLWSSKIKTFTLLYGHFTNELFREYELFGELRGRDVRLMGVLDELQLKRMRELIALQVSSLIFDSTCDVVFLELTQLGEEALELIERGIGRAELTARTDEGYLTHLVEVFSRCDLAEPQRTRWWNIALKIPIARRMYIKSTCFKMVYCPPQTAQSRETNGALISYGLWVSQTPLSEHQCKLLSSRVKLKRLLDRGEEREWAAEFSRLNQLKDALKKVNSALLSASKSTQSPRGISSKSLMSYYVSEHYHSVSFEILEGSAWTHRGPLRTLSEKEWYHVTYAEQPHRYPGSNTPAEISWKANYDEDFLMGSAGALGGNRWGVHDLLGSRIEPFHCRQTWPQNERWHELFGAFYVFELGLRLTFVANVPHPLPSSDL